ncbi:hypothetical protein [Spirillospora sp. NBC_01491]|uniref:hypothetical protein n=1 Tax=Spirillospora sp. NBC_01491 TaxID=2976007 RepID=UPI002E305DBB|nr:hypothetical protein [Spirillospora sp. NBC_01491]
MTLDEITEMVSDCRADGLITFEAAVGILADATGLGRPIAAALLIADHARLDDWRSLDGWRRWEES